MAQILVIEDEPDGREAMVQYLRRVGHQVESAPDGHEAIGSILHKLPDLIVLDLCLPVMDGAGVLEVVRSYLRLRGLPVVVWTGLGDSPLVDKVRGLNVNSVLIKGTASFNDMKEAIEQALRKQRAN